MHTEQLRYCILDPTGNITALVESSVGEKDQPAVAALIMQQHPSVEQVGFVQYHGEYPVCLRMAGGEFCGNASMSAAALFLFRHSPYSGAAVSSSPEVSGSAVSALKTSALTVSVPEASAPIVPNPVVSGTKAFTLGSSGSECQSVLLRVSGTPDPVNVCLKRLSEDRFEGCVTMPPALNIEKHPFTFQALSGMLPLVLMEGISHLIIEPDSVFFSLKDKRPEAEAAIRTWCHALGAKGLGLMFLDRRRSVPALIPLVYIPGGDTVFWENSCASGTSAAGMYLAQKTGFPLSLSLQEPGGILRVESDPVPDGETCLYGQVQLISLHP